MAVLAAAIQSSRSTPRGLIAHAALACILILSAWLQWTTIRETHVVAPARPDAASYVSYAYNLRAFGVYSRAHTWNEDRPAIPGADSVSPPGYPLFLAAFLRGKPDIGFMYRVVAAQAILGVLTTLIIFLLARMVLSPLLACIPALLTALTPQMATISTYLLTESLFTALLALSMLLFAAAIRSRKPWQWALAGTVFALCCLVRPTLQPLLPLSLLVILSIKHWRHLARTVALATACWAIFLLPWFVYQQSVPANADNPNLLRATLYHGSFPDFMYEGRIENYGYPYRDDPHAAEVMASNAGLTEWVGARMRAQPLRYVKWYLLGKPRYFLSWYPVAAAGDIFIYPVDASPFLSRTSFQLVHALMYGLHWPLMLFAIAGGFVAWLLPGTLGLSTSAIAPTRLIALVFLSAIVLHMIGAPFPRYSIPFRPLAFVLATAAIRAATRSAMTARRRAGTGRPVVN